jgi:dTDP-4-amino-4,6-dideoxygalactose transaminase
LEIKNLIPFFGIDRQYLTIRDELLNASDEVYRTGQVLGGQQTFNFELAIAERCQRRYAVAVGSCTQGLIFSLMAGPKAGEKVMIPTISFAATINSVLLSTN